MTADEYLYETEESNRRRELAFSRGEKLGWYRQYGVRECWLVDPFNRRVTVVDFAGPSPVHRNAKGADTIRSTVLPDLELSTDTLLPERALRNDM